MTDITEYRKMLESKVVISDRVGFAVDKDSLSGDLFDKCWNCGQAMEYEVCETCNGKGWTDPSIPDNACPVCDQHGGQWVCPKCGMAEH